MVKPNTKFLKRNALRMSQNADSKKRIKRVDEMEGSLQTLQHLIDKERIFAYKEIVGEFAKTYHINNKGEVLDLIQRASQFKGEQANIFMKLASGEHIKLAKPHNHKPSF